jgi:hypothetical protein
MALPSDAAIAYGSLSQRVSKYARSESLNSHYNNGTCSIRRGGRVVDGSGLENRRA